MSKSSRRRFVPITAVAAAAVMLLLGYAASAQSRWVGIGPDGKLVYAHLTTGDHIPDYSFAGYRGGGVAIPNVPFRTKVSPTGADDTAAIQRAIDLVSKLPLVDGIRGAVELAPGVFQCSGTIHINASGVVLRAA